MSAAVEEVTATGVEVTAAVLGPATSWLTPDQRLFRAASVTKTFVAATALRLEEQGVLALDELVAGQLPPATENALRAAGYDLSAMTLAHLLGHTAGLPDHSVTDEYLQAVLAVPDRRWTPEEQLQIALRVGSPLAPPGELRHYSDTGYVLAGSLLSAATGRPLGEAVATVLPLPPSTLWEIEVPSDPFPQRVGDLSVWDIDASVDLYGGGGLVTTASDLATFIRMLFAGEVVSPVSLQRMKAPVAQGSADGLGLLRAPEPGTVYGHTGFWGTAMLFDEEAGVAVGLATGQAPSFGGPDPGTLALRLLGAEPRNTSEGDDGDART